MWPQWIFAVALHLWRHTVSYVSMYVRIYGRESLSYFGCCYSSCFRAFTGNAWPLSNQIALASVKTQYIYTHIYIDSSRSPIAELSWVTNLDNCTNIGYWRCYVMRCGRDGHWQWLKIVVLLPGGQQQITYIYTYAHIWLCICIYVLPYIFYCSGSWKEMKIVLCGYAKKYAMHSFFSPTRQRATGPCKKFK